jgi:hypothetical protein
MIAFYPRNPSVISFLQLVGKGPVTDTEDGSFTIQQAGLLRNTPANRVLDTLICHRNELYHGWGNKDAIKSTNRFFAQMQ